MKLVDALGTHYFHSDWAATLSAFFREHNGEEIDFADARITYDCMREVRSATDRPGCNFCDSMDAERDALLKERIQVAAQLAELKENPPQRLPIPTELEDVKTYMKKEYPKVYTISASDKRSLYWAVLLMAKRPDVRMDTRGWIDALFELINKYYPSYRYAGKKVYWLDGYVLRTEDAPSSDFCAKHHCIPYSFGNEDCTKLEEWKVPLQKMSRDFQNIIIPRTYHITDYL